VFIKDLSILQGGRVLKDIIIVDNKIESYSSNLENGIPIISYYGQEGDTMLKKLAKYLLKLKDSSDVRMNILRDFYL
jgi:CTD small phosphatase-like protein 2